VHTSESGDGKVPAEPWGNSKVRTADEGANGKKSQVRGLVALVSTTRNGTKQIEFVDRDFNAAINGRKCAVLEKRPPKWTRGIFIGQPLRVELYEKKIGSSRGWPVEKD